MKGKIMKGRVMGRGEIGENNRRENIAEWGNVIKEYDL